MNRYYNDYSTWIKTVLPYKVQKISIDAGFSCPNRDGKISYGGCVFCDNRTFNPSYCNPKKSISQQILEGKKFFGNKYPDMKYLAYFQAFTNTYAPIDELKRMYSEALEIEDVVGIVIGTRPDCISDDLLDFLEELNKRTFVIIEYGIESANDKTLKKINRGHDFECSRDAICRTHEHGILCCGHVILGLPGENEEECFNQARTISQLPIDILKIHQLQVIKGTKLAAQYAERPFKVYSVDEYIKLLAEYIRNLNPDIVLERFVSQSPSDMLIAPKWGLKNYEFTNLFMNYLKKENIKQGDLYLTVM